MPWGPTSRHARGYGTAWDKLRKIILARDNHLCQRCDALGLTTQGRTVDHIQPKAQGGTDDPDNLRTLCDECHRVVSLEQRGFRDRPTIGPDGFPIKSGELYKAERESL